jgi:NAD(P)-dependent dehydrogenase (short-subunit alcohol dehydrogenase family)
MTGDDLAEVFHGALVTGGASGIGAGVVARLRSAGVPVVVADLHDPGTDQFVQCDVKSPQSCATAVAEAERQVARLDLVVLCAGISGDSSTPESMDLDGYRTLVGTNLDGVTFGIRAVVPALRRHGGGAIVALSSLAAISPTADNPLYSMTKAAVVGLVRALGPVLQRDGIRCNAVCPGFTDTPMVDRLRPVFDEHGFPLIARNKVVDAVLTAAASPGSGEVYVVQAGHETARYRFRGVPGARASATAQPVPVPRLD